MNGQGKSLCGVRISRGMTLVELLISMTIITLLMGSFMWMLLAGKAAYQSSATHSRTRQELQVAFHRTVQELRESNYNTITLVPAGFSFLSARDRSGDFVTDNVGAPVWQKYVLYYIPANTTKLMRKEVYGSYTDALSQSAFSSYADDSGFVISSAISRGTYLLDPSRKTCTLTMELSRTNDHGKTDQQAVTALIYPKN
jgi:prepilin-type N-terminal cleavage/methylation domain-containing protein